MFIDDNISATSPKTED